MQELYASGLYAGIVGLQVGKWMMANLRDASFYCWLIGSDDEFGGVDELCDDDVWMSEGREKKSLDWFWLQKSEKCCETRSSRTAN